MVQENELNKKITILQKTTNKKGETHHNSDI